MKIMAIIYNNQDSGTESYGYLIWQSLKELFHIYLNDCDVRNVYHHLKELYELDLIERMDSSQIDELYELDLIERMDSSQIDANKRCFYTITRKGIEMKRRYDPYIEILEKSPSILSKY
jgi:hypothetical protein